MAGGGARVPWWLKVLIGFGTVLVVVSTGALVGGNMLLNRYEGQVETTALLPADEGTNLEGPLTILLAGVDEDSDREGTRSDTIILAHVNAAHDKVYLVSIPRDSYVNVPANPATGWDGGKTKINAAFQLGAEKNGGRKGGFSLLTRTIQELVPGITFDAGAIVNFKGLIKVVDALGGIDVYVDDTVTSIHVGFDKNGKRTNATRYGRTIPGVRPMVYNVGMMHMNAWQALDFSRQRDLLGRGDSDYGRQRHQQQVLKAMLKKAADKGMTNPIALDKVLKAAGQALTVDPGGKKLRDWIFTLKSIEPDAITMVKTNGGKLSGVKVGDEWVEILQPASMQLLQSIRDDTVDAFVAANPTWVSKV